MTKILLDLGAGDRSPEGFIPLGNAHGSSIYPLPYDDGTVDVIRASHVLEHFGHREVPAVLADWVRALKVGGVLRIAVPDFAALTDAYKAGDRALTEFYVMGDQIEPDGFHKTIYDERHLRELLSDAGLTLIRRWESELDDDCASFAVSCNLEGSKPAAAEMKVVACMSVPRLGFMDNFGCAFDSLVPLNVKLYRQGGAFWGQALTNCMERVLERDQPDAILTLDYDSVFEMRHVAHLMQLMMVHPEADAIAPIQSSRHQSTALFTVLGDDGKALAQIPFSRFDPDLTPIATAHFGLTLIRASKLVAMPKPWFLPVPNEEGRWHDGKIDEDVNFWKRWREEGNTLLLANRVAIGHAELMVRWPGKDLQAFYQPMREFNEAGAPEGVWR